MRIDLHSHMIPGVDDGCPEPADSIASIKRLIEAGYVGTVCTPHVWPELFPDNTPANIRRWTEDLSKRLKDEGIDYQLWPGGELRLFEECIDWLKANGVPVYADTNYVLADFWDDTWPKHVDQTFDWLKSEGYQPILAHPERIGIKEGLDEHLDDLTARGVLLQGNCRCMTGEDGYLADQRVRQYIQQNRYWVLALDTHTPGDLESRLDGLKMVADEFGQDYADYMTITRPRELLGLNGTA